MNIKFDDKKISCTGRWGFTDSAAVSTACGSYFRFRFNGSTAVMCFDVTLSQLPQSHIYIRADGGALTESALDHYLRVSTSEGTHDVTVILKSMPEGDYSRWKEPLVSRIALKSIEADGFETPAPDLRKSIEFVGDSITEGILVNPEKTPYPSGAENRPYQDDVTATYAWLTAEKLNLRPVFMGYGAVGITRGGSGGVPKIIESYPYCWDGKPRSCESADIILINHGANDYSAKPEDYANGYYKLLGEIRKQNPHSVIIALSPFCGVHASCLGKCIERFNKDTSDSVHFIDSTGWVPSEPLHPYRSGHKIIAAHLTAELSKILA